MVRRSFEPSEDSVGAARRFVVGSLPDVASEVRESVSVMVSELSTNALVHGASAFEVAVERSDGEVLVSVHDRGDGTPALQSPDAREPHGRGLRIVAALSDEWGISSTAEAGKTVWFRMSIDSTAADTPTGGTARLPVDGTTAQGEAPPDRRGAPLVPAERLDSRMPTSRHRGPGWRNRVRPRPSIAPAVVSGP